MTDTPENHTTRRSLIRTIGGVALTTAIAGCSSIDAQGRSGNSETRSETKSITADSESLSRESLAGAVDSFASTYDANGVWGLAEREPEHGLEYVGAWTTSLAAEREDGESAFTSDHTLVLYEIPDVELDSERLYRAWLWSAATPEPDSSCQLKSIRPSVSLPRETDDMRHYSPSEDTTAERVSVELSRPNTDGPVVDFPLHEGTIGYVGEDTSVGSAGEYTPFWSGEYAGTQSVNATCEMKWPKSKAHEIEWSVRVEATT